MEVAEPITKAATSLEKSPRNEIMARRSRDEVRGFLLFAFHLATTMALSQERPSQYHPRFFEGLPSMVGNSIVITGCSRVLGLVTAEAMASKGATVCTT